MLYASIAAAAAAAAGGRGRAQRARSGRRAGGARRASGAMDQASRHQIANGSSRREWKQREAAALLAELLRNEGCAAAMHCSDIRTCPLLKPFCLPRELCYAWDPDV